MGKGGREGGKEGEREGEGSRVQYGEKKQGRREGGQEYRSGGWWEE